MLIALTHSTDQVAEATARWGQPGVRHLLHDTGENETSYPVLLQWDVAAEDVAAGPQIPGIWWFEQFEPPLFAGGAVDFATSDIFVVFNNAQAGRETEAERWYREAHVPETFEHYGFTAGWRFRDRSAEVGLAAAPFGYLTGYGVASGRLLAGEHARLELARERVAAAARGEQPAVPVPASVVGPRYAQYYSRVAA